MDPSAPDAPPAGSPPSPPSGDDGRREDAGTGRLRRALEIVYAVHGVGAARVWMWDEKIAVGVRPLVQGHGPELLHRVEAALASLKEPGEAWDFGFLDEDG